MRIDVLLSICLIQATLCGCGPTRDTYPIPTAFDPMPTSQGDSPLNAPLEPAIDWVKLVYVDNGENVIFTVKRTSTFFASNSQRQFNGQFKGRLSLEEFSELDARLRVISQREIRTRSCEQSATQLTGTSIRISKAAGGSVDLYSGKANTECFRGSPAEVRELEMYLRYLCDQYLR